jgi:hypothetical protein
MLDESPDGLRNMLKIKLRMALPLGCLPKAMFAPRFDFPADQGTKPCLWKVTVLEPVAGRLSTAKLSFFIC